MRINGAEVYIQPQLQQQTSLPLIGMRGVPEIQTRQTKPPVVSEQKLFSAPPQ
jgi:hypothetical protein